MRIRWTVPAAEDLESIRNYLQQHSPHFAEPTVRTIYQRIRSLKNLTEPGQTRPSKRHQGTGAYAAPVCRGLRGESRSR
jgi:plasmid stabilization system protein ParE